MIGFNRYKKKLGGTGLKAQLVRGLLGVGWLKILSMPLALSTSVILARFLGPEGYGQYVFVFSLIGFLALPVGPGPGQLITREVAKFHHDRAWDYFSGIIRRSFQWVFFSSLIMMTVILVVAISYAEWQPENRWALVVFASFLIPLLGVNTIRANVLRGLRFVVLAQLPTLMVRPGLHLLFVGGFLAIGILTPLSAILSQVVATAVAVLIGTVLALDRIPLEVKRSPPRYHDKFWLSAIVPLSLLVLVGTLNGQIGIISLGLLVGDEDVANMQVALSASILIAFPLSIVNLVIGPYVTGAMKENDTPRIRSLSVYSSFIAIMAASPIAIPLIVWGEEVVGLVYGQDYIAGAINPLMILCIGQIFNVVFGSVGVFLTMTGHERDTLSGQLFAAAINVSLCFALVPAMGATGAATATSIGLVTWNVILAYRFFKRLGFFPGIVGFFYKD